MNNNDYNKYDTAKSFIIFNYFKLVSVTVRLRGRSNVTRCWTIYFIL